MMSSPRRYPMIWKTGWLLGTVLAIGSLLFIKVTYHSGQEFAQAEWAHQRGAYEDAITHYERAIKWYTPLSTSVQHAVEQLWAIGVAAEKRGDTTLALAAYRALRGSLYAVQSVYVPFQDWIPKTETRIVALMAATMPGAGEDTAIREKHRARFAHMFRHDTRPHVGWSLVAVSGFLGWVGATIGLIWYAVTDEGGWAWRPGLLWGSGIAVCFVAWIFGLLYT